MIFDWFKNIAKGVNETIAKFERATGIDIPIVGTDLKKEKQQKQTQIEKPKQQSSGIIKIEYPKEMRERIEKISKPTPFVEEVEKQRNVTKPKPDKSSGGGSSEKSKRSSGSGSGGIKKEKNKNVEKRKSRRRSSGGGTSKRSSKNSESTEYYEITLENAYGEQIREIKKQIGDSGKVEILPDLKDTSKIIIRIYPLKPDIKEKLDNLYITPSEVLRKQHQEKMKQIRNEIKMKTMKEIYEKSGILEKAGLYASTLLSEKGWDLVVGLLPNEIEKGLRETWNKSPLSNIFGKTNVTPVSYFGKKGRKVSDVVAERMKELHEYEGNVAVKGAVDVFTSPVGITLTEMFGNALGATLLAKAGVTATKSGKFLQGFTRIGTAGAIEGAIQTSPVAYQYYKNTGDIKGALIMTATGGAFGFTTAGIAGGIFTKGGKWTRRAVTGVAYGLDFPGEIMGDMGSLAISKVKVLTFTPSQALTQTQMQSESQTQKHAQKVKGKRKKLRAKRGASTTQGHAQTSTTTQTSTQTTTQTSTTTQAVTQTISNVFVPVAVPEITPQPTKSQSEIPTPKKITPTKVTSETPTQAPTTTPSLSIVPTPKAPFLLMPFFGSDGTSSTAGAKSKFVNEKQLISNMLSMFGFPIAAKTKNVKKKR